MIFHRTNELFSMLSLVNKKKKQEKKMNEKKMNEKVYFRLDDISHVMDNLILGQ